MESTLTPSRKLGVSIVVMALVMGVASVVAAQAGPSSSCTGGSTAQFGESFFGLEDGGNRLLSTTPSAREYPLELPAGTYALDAVSYDGYEQREDISGQTQEQWFAEFLGADGSVLATSGITADLEDGVTEATWSGAIGEVTLAEAATTIRVVHAAPGSASVNSVRPVCVGATDTSTPPPTEAPAPTQAPAPGSDVAVEFVSTADSSSTVSITCAALAESALGTQIDLQLTDVPASTGCVVEYPATLDCAMSVDPASTMGASGPGIQNILIPADGGAEILMTLDCVQPQIPVATTTPTVPPASPTTTTAPAVVDTEVGGQVETAPAATAQTGTPAFTG